MSRITLSLLMSSVFVYSAASQANFYINTGAYYSKVEKPIDQQGLGGSIGIGYELNKSWSAELSYDNLIDETGKKPYSLNQKDPVSLDWGNAYQHKGFTLSALGKTEINPAATLFYRIGVISSDIDYTHYTLGKTDCGTAAYNTINQSFTSTDGKSVQHTTACSYEDTSTDLVLGLGVETDFTKELFGRIEVVHFFANKGEAITAAKLSVAYKF